MRQRLSNRDPLQSRLHHSRNVVDVDPTDRKCGATDFGGDRGHQLEPRKILKRLRTAWKYRPHADVGRALQDRLPRLVYRMGRHPNDHLRAAQLADVPEIRSEKVAEIRAAIASGSYETEEKISAALDRFLDLEG